MINKLIKYTVIELIIINCTVVGIDPQFRFVKEGIIVGHSPNCRTIVQEVGAEAT